MRSLRKNESGFTLIELLIVAIIVAVLAAVGLPLLRGNVERARLTEAEAALGTIRTAMRAELAENTEYPTFAVGTAVIGSDIGLNAGDLCGRFFGDNDYKFGPNTGDTTFCVRVTGSGVNGTCAAGGAPRGEEVPITLSRSMNQDGDIFANATCTGTAIN